jgi:hypothetical protein
MMTVSELIEFLKTQPQDLQVAYEAYSEHVLLDCEDIEIKECCEPRADGWIHHKRDDKPSQMYLILPGN